VNQIVPSFLFGTRWSLLPDTIGAACVPSAFAGQREEKLMQQSQTKAAVPHEPAGKSNRAVPVPHFINEDRSDMRAIKSGWYAMDNGGNLVVGPFAAYEKCVEEIMASRQ
jgi:hypothetical protein